MKIVLRYDEKKNGFYLAPDECEVVPAGVVSAKSYCETAGFLPTKIVIEVPGSIVSPDDEARVMARIDELTMKLQAYEGQGQPAGNEPVPAGEDKMHKNKPAKETK